MIVSGNSAFEQHPICFSEIDRNGEFLFRAVAPGKYLIRPAFDNKNLKLHIQPESFEFQVVRDTVILKDSFEVG